MHIRPVLLIFVVGERSIFIRFKGVTTVVSTEHFISRKWLKILNFVFAKNIKKKKIQVYIIRRILLFLDRILLKHNWNDLGYSIYIVFKNLNFERF